jgi:large subunit ribosomal protein L21
MSYAIVSIGGKQYRVQEGERLLVDRVATGEGKTFHPNVLLLGGDGQADLAPKGATVTARVVGHVLGEKVRIGKYRPKTGYRRHTGFRARLSQIEIEAIGARKAAAAKKERPAVAEAPKEAPAPKAKEEAPEGLPKGYAEMTVAQISEAASEWRRPMLEAALAYEQEHSARKGAIAALESALAKKEETG